MSGPVAQFQSLAERPPLWVRVASPFVVALVGYGMARNRGWVVGIATAAFFAALMLPTAVNPRWTVAWSRRHPLVDGAVLGPLLFLLVAAVTPWPLWVCVLVGLPGVVLGAAMGVRRSRRRPPDEAARTGD